MNDEQLCEAVAAEINRLDPERSADSDHTGGGIFCVDLRGLRTGQHWLFGMSNETWGGDLYATEEDWDQFNVSDISVNTQVPSDSQDVNAIATAILDAIKE